MMHGQTKIKFEFKKPANKITI